MEYYKYEAANKWCKKCEIPLIEEFWVDHRSVVKRRHNGLYCPKCNIKFHIKMEFYPRWLSRVEHVLFSENKKLIREVREDELIKMHGVMAWWFPIGKILYAEPELILDEALNNFRQKYRTPENILVYLLNNHLQRRYFMIPKDAIT